MNGRRFDLQQDADAHWKLFEAIQSLSTTNVWCGSDICNVLAEKSKDQSSTLVMTLEAIKVY